MNAIPIRYCLRCGKIIRNYKIYQFELQFPLPFIRRDQYEFCSKCYGDFKDFMSAGGMVKYRNHGVHVREIKKENIKDIICDEIESEGNFDEGT